MLVDDFGTIICRMDGGDELRLTPGQDRYYRIRSEIPLEMGR